MSRRPPDAKQADASGCLHSGGPRRFSEMPSGTLRAIMTGYLRFIQQHWRFLAFGVLAAFLTASVALAWTAVPPRKRRKPA